MEFVGNTAITLMPNFTICTNQYRLSSLFIYQDGLKWCGVIHYDGCSVIKLTQRRLNAVHVDVTQRRGAGFDDVIKSVCFDKHLIIISCKLGFKMLNLATSE